jgi:thiaminase
VCEAPKSSFGEGNSSSWQLGDYWLYFQKIIFATQGDETERWEARQCLENRTVGTSKGIVWNMECIPPTTIIVPNILHTVYLGLLKHMMNWVMSCLEQHFRIDKFNQLWAMMPPYPGFAQFNKPYSQVMQWSGKEMKALGRVIVPAFAATLLNPLASQRIPFTEALLCIKNLVYFHLMAQYQYHTEATTEYMENYLEEFHRPKDVFSQFRASESAKKVSEALKKQLTLDKQEERESDPAWNNVSAAAKSRRIYEDKTQIVSEIAQRLINKSDFNFVKMHRLNHFSDHIRQLGNLLNVSSELPEKVMMDLKQAFQQSNRHEAAFQILRTKARKKVFQY